MPSRFDRLFAGRFRWLVVCLCLTSPLPAVAQGPASSESDNPFTSARSSIPSGFSSSELFAPYSHQARQSRVPAMQPAFVDASGFNWSQFFKGMAATGTQLAAPKLFLGDGRGEMGGGSLFRANSGFDGRSGDSLALSARGVNFGTKSSGLDLHLSVNSMFPNGFSSGNRGSSFGGGGLGTGAGGLGSLGGLGSPGGLGALGGRDAGKGSGARVSLQLKF